MKIICIIPAFNEEKTIIQVVNSVKPYVSEVVVVDDGSEDKTGELVSKHCSVSLLRHIINRGQGAALETGTEYALKEGADIIVHFDADGQFVAEEIKEVIQPIKDGQADIVFGSRFLNKRSQIPFFKKNFIMPLAHFTNKMFFGVNFTDPQNGFRALDAEAAGKIQIEQREMAHCSEILHKALSGKFRIKEAPVTVIYHNFGQRFFGGIKIVKELLLGALIK